MGWTDVLGNRKSLAAAICAARTAYWHLPAPDGESFQDAGERLTQALRRICASNSGNIAIISHSGATRGWLCRELGLPSDDVLRLPQPYGGITAADWTGAGFRILYCGMQPSVISEGSAASA